MKYFSLIFFVLFVLASCNEESISKETTSEQTNTTTGPTIRINAQIPETDSLVSPAFADSMVTGAYQGMFPCKNCEDAQKTILFNMNHTYLQEQMEGEKNSRTTRSSGEWRVNGDLVELFQKNKPAVIFRLINDSLFAVKINDIPIRDSLKYLLTQKELAGERQIWRQKRAEGIDFVGMGNEPFWNVEMKKGTMRFRLMEWKKPIAASIREVEKNNDSTVYHLVSDKKEWTVTVLPKFCSDGMSDFLYQHKVKVNYGNKHYNGCGIMLYEEMKNN